jgi:hypothetical protein
MSPSAAIKAVALSVAIGAVSCSSPPSSPASPANPVAKPGESDLRIQVVDFYGLRRVNEADARATLAVKVGDTISLAGGGRPAVFDESERRLGKLPGIANAHLNLVCCEGSGGIIYVGIEEKDSPAFRFRPTPQGTARLPDDVVKAGQEFLDALTAAVRRGDSAEDISHGQSIMRDPATRAVQMRFIAYALDPARFRDVLRNSSDASHRALAAQILGYATNKRGVIGDLVYGMSDPSEDVRNNSMRALAVFVRAERRSPLATTHIPPNTFVALLSSPVWSDRNKASMALMELSEGRDPRLFDLLRRRAMLPLVEMARWKSEGHAMPAFTMLGRLAGLSENEIQAAWKQGQREAVIALAVKPR